jgi:hypothetical protein
VVARAHSPNPHLTPKRWSCNGKRRGHYCVRFAVESPAGLLAAIKILLFFCTPCPSAPRISDTQSSRRGALLLVHRFCRHGSCMTTGEPLSVRRHAASVYSERAGGERPCLAAGENHANGPCIVSDPCLPAH